MNALAKVVQPALEWPADNQLDVRLSLALDEQAEVNLTLISCS